MIYNKIQALINSNNSIQGLVDNQQINQFYRWKTWI